MSDLAEGLFSFLAADATLAAWVGSRIYPLVRPQNAPLPAITYQRISGPRTASHSGDSGLTNPRYQFNCWAGTYLEAREIAEQLVALCHGQRGMMPEIQASFVDNDLDDYLPDVQEFRVIVDVIFWFQEHLA